MTSYSDLYFYTHKDITHIDEELKLQSISYQTETLFIVAILPDKMTELPMTNTRKTEGLSSINYF